MEQLIPVITINWNGIEDTLECVEALFNQTYSNFQIHLIDNNSKQSDKDILQEKFANEPKVVLYFNQENLGFTGATNKILQEVILPQGFPYVALLNNDAMADKDWLKQLLRMAEEEQVDMVSTKMINYYVRNLIDNTGHFMLNTGEVMPHGFGNPIDHHNQARDNFGACAGAALYSVEMLKKIGCFDDFFTTGYEDAELGVRALITGYKLRYQPKAIAYHKMSASINKVRNEDYMVYIQESIFFSYLKLMPKPVILLNIGFIIFRTFVLLFLFTIFMRWGYFRIYFKSLQKLNQDWSLLREKRRLFFQQNEVLSSSTIIRKQTFFLWDNVKRFFIYFIQGKRTVFEKI